MSLNYKTGWALLLVVAGVLLGGMAAIGGAWPWTAATPSLVRWTAINVNEREQQGDAHWLEIDGKVNVLIDAGHLAYASNMVSFFKDRGITHLDAVILTHGHHDHYGCLPFLLVNTVRVDVVYFNPPSDELIKKEPWGCSRAEIDWVLGELARRQIPVKPMVPGMTWALGPNVQLECLYCFDGIHTPVGLTDINDTSAILRLTHRQVRFLFTGDLGPALGNDLAKTAPDRLRADVLKVPHHGAEALPDTHFFDAVCPGAMVVPAPAALWNSERCKKVRDLTSRYPAYVNGLVGNIVVESDGRQIQIRSGSPAGPLLQTIPAATSR